MFGVPSVRITTDVEGAERSSKYSAVMRLCFLEWLFRPKSNRKRNDAMSFLLRLSNHLIVKPFDDVEIRVGLPVEGLQRKAARICVIQAPGGRAIHPQQLAGVRQDAQRACAFGDLFHILDVIVSINNQVKLTRLRDTQGWFGVVDHG